MPKVIQNIILEDINQALIMLKERLSNDVLIALINLLYRRGIYGQEATLVSEIFGELAKELDQLLSDRATDLEKEIIASIDRTYIQINNTLNIAPEE